MNTPSMPPVPQGLREMLKDYPEYIQIIQNDLNKMMSKPSHGIDPFDRAIWLLESTLGAFIHEAQDELKVAEEIGDPVAEDQAKKKVRLMFRASSKNGGMSDLNDLWSDLQAHAGSR